MIIFAYIRLVVHAECGPKILTCPYGALGSSKFIHTNLRLCFRDKVLVPSLICHTRTQKWKTSSKEVIYYPCMHDKLASLRSGHGKVDGERHVLYLSTVHAIPSIGLVKFQVFFCEAPCVKGSISLCFKRCRGSTRMLERNDAAA